MPNAAAAVEAGLPPHLPPTVVARRAFIERLLTEPREEWPRGDGHPDTKATETGMPKNASYVIHNHPLDRCTNGQRKLGWKRINTKDEGDWPWKTFLVRIYRYWLMTEAWTHPFEARTLIATSYFPNDANVQRAQSRLYITDSANELFIPLEDDSGILLKRLYEVNQANNQLGVLEETCNAVLARLNRTHDPDTILQEACQLRLCQCLGHPKARPNTETLPAWMRVGNDTATEYCAKTLLRDEAMTKANCPNHMIRHWATEATVCTVGVLKNAVMELQRDVRDHRQGAAANAAAEAGVNLRNQRLNNLGVN